MADAKDGISMLAKLAGDIVTTKTKAGSKLSPGLTPVAGEIAAGLPRTPAAFPNDTPNDVVRQAIERIEAEIAALDGVVTALKLLIGETTAAVIAQEAAVTQKLLEKEADRRVADAAKAAAGDKKAIERVNAASPLAEVVEAAEARDRKRAAVLTAMMGEAAAVTPARESLVEQTAEFGANFERLKQEAQASAFGHQPVETPAQAAAAQNAVTAAKPGNGWTCPQHGDTMIAVKVSPRRGVQFRKCAVVDCHEFEKV